MGISEKDLDEMVEAYTDEKPVLHELAETAGCAEVNLGNIKRLALQDPIVAIAWCQAMGVVKSVQKLNELDED